MTAIQFLFINSLHELVGLGAWEFVVSHPNRKGRGLDGAPDVRGEIDRRRSSGAEALVGLVGFFGGWKPPAPSGKTKAKARAEARRGSASYPTQTVKGAVWMGHRSVSELPAEKCKDKNKWRLCGYVPRSQNRDLGHPAVWIPMSENPDPGV
jgi:hypothetical protein